MLLAKSTSLALLGVTACRGILNFDWGGQFLRSISSRSHERQVSVGCGVELDSFGIVVFRKHVA